MARWTILPGESVGTFGLDHVGKDIDLSLTVVVSERVRVKGSGAYDKFQYPGAVAQYLRGHAAAATQEVFGIFRLTWHLAERIVALPQGT
jgi:hypothetical protein